MDTDFERFIGACKAWPTSSVVRERGRVMPTYLLKTAPDELRYGDFRLGTTNFSLAAAIGELAFNLDVQTVSAFALIVPSEIGGMNAEAVKSVNPRFLEFRNYEELLLIQAFSIDGATRTLFGLTNNYASGIAHWEEIDDALKMGGAVGDLAAEVARRWRDGVLSIAAG